MHRVWTQVCPTLIGRFKEREENVKMDVFATFNDILLHVAAGGSADAVVVDAMAVDSGNGSARTPAKMLRAEVPRVVKAVSKQLKEKSVKTRVASFNCLRQLARSFRLARWKQMKNIEERL